LKKTIVHQISLSNIIGGVQLSFLEYFKEATKTSKFNHEVFGMHPLGENLDFDVSKYKNIKSSIFIFLQFCYRLYSKNYIIHFYNNLGSKKLFYLLKFIPSNNIIFHERGTSWNLPKSKGYIIKSNIKKSVKVIVNSEASRILLRDKFNIKIDNIEVLYNGIYLSSSKPLKVKTEKRFKIGFLGRLDTHKGVHSFIDLSKIMKNHIFHVAGTGSLESLLHKYGSSISNLKFLGRVSSSDFLSNIDLLIVPSIREPLGNVIIEAGFLKCPVIASNIDGIPEIIDNNLSGILISPTIPLREIDLPHNAVSYPEFVVDGITRKLTTPKELDILKLKDAVNFLLENNLKRNEISEDLFKKVKANFSLSVYFDKLESIYMSI
tara:strand:- start:1143 stop:2273 length:1131 start_codon:yes stop_codon:yes gene_type:complete